MDMRPEWVTGIRAWGDANPNLAEIWLFGSRAKGCARPDSDVDLALVLAPADGAHDWALGNYFAVGAEWRAALETIVGRHVSLELFPRPTEVLHENIAEARGSALCLWSATSGQS